MFSDNRLLQIEIVLRVYLHCIQSESITCQKIYYMYKVVDSILECTLNATLYLPASDISTYIALEFKVYYGTDVYS